MGWLTADRSAELEEFCAVQVLNAAEVELFPAATEEAEEDGGAVPVPLGVELNAGLDGPEGAAGLCVFCVLGLAWLLGGNNKVLSSCREDRYGAKTEIKMEKI